MRALREGEGGTERKLQIKACFKLVVEQKWNCFSLSECRDTVHLLTTVW